MSTLTIEERIKVHAPPKRVWKFLLDPARVAACLPGAKLDGTEGEDTFLGTMKVKVGPVMMEIKGKATMSHIDPVARKVTLTGTGNDKAGGGSARMDMKSEIVALEDGGSEILVMAEVHLAGKLVRFGRGMMEGISKQLFKQFAERVHGALDEDDDEEEEDENEAEPTPEGGQSADDDGPAGEGPAAETKDAKPAETKAEPPPTADEPAAAKDEKAAIEKAPSKGGDKASAGKEEKASAAEENKATAAEEDKASASNGDKASASNGDKASASNGDKAPADTAPAEEAPSVKEEAREGATKDEKPAETKSESPSVAEEKAPAEKDDKAAGDKDASPDSTSEKAASAPSKPAKEAASTRPKKPGSSLAPTKKKNLSKRPPPADDNAPLDAGSLVWAAIWAWFRGLFDRIFGGKKE